MNKIGLYDPRFEHDNCAVGFVANINGRYSHQIVTDGITVLKNLVHRGADDTYLDTGDGAGILTQIPHGLFAKYSTELSFHLPGKGNYGLGMFFLPIEKEMQIQVSELVEETVIAEQGTILGWREVPINVQCLSKKARDSMPAMKQIFVEFSSCHESNLERKLYIVRKCIEKKVDEKYGTLESFYIPSFSSKTICYKGMLRGSQLEEFYLDLSDSDYRSSLALVHLRYSTNTFPSWNLAQPLRWIAHNGEITTINGNVAKMKAREKTLSSEYFDKDIDKLFPIIRPGMTDSGAFDNVFELLTQNGRSIEHVMMMMIPEAFGPKYHISQDKRSFYEYQASIMEPWDGPAALVFTDGAKIGAILDRNGLRPARYIVTKSKKIVLASEVGVLDIPPEEILQKGRLGPGKMIIVDTKRKRIINDNEIKSSISRKKPYRRWIENNSIQLKGLFQTPGTVTIKSDSLQTRQKAFGYTLEDVNMIITPMAANAQESVGSMGNDACLAVLSEKPRLLYDYFKQLFAQVTNPPLDPYRENLVMSLMSFVGREGNLFDETPECCCQLKLPHPILTNDDMDELHTVDIENLRSRVIKIFFGTKEKGTDLVSALDKACKEAEYQVDQGASLLILSDRDIDKFHVPIPALLATSAIHHHLLKKGKRHRTGLVVETGEAREVMHFATLVGYGASAINPYLAFETIADLHQQHKLPSDIKIAGAIDNYIMAIKKGLLKILSKVGISTIRSFRGAKIFEAVGLHSELVDQYFSDTPSRIEGIKIDVLAHEARQRHARAYALEHGLESSLEPGGNIHFRNYGEKHIYKPRMIPLLQKAVNQNNYAIYKKFTSFAHGPEQDACTLRDLFKFVTPNPKTTTKPISLGEVEKEENIIKRFVTSAMSFGSISKETHETLALAMNRIGAKSNSGEGGEDDKRYQPLTNGDRTQSMVKQIASARFGVTISYLINADELQIKIAQGSKPGEGGHLPEYKVDKTIAETRHCTPGVILLSPPPHHDIYSIEDFAQLIYDLKNVHPNVRTSVKLAAEVGVGSIAAGVAKAKADKILISGYDGGTGASPISSMLHAGIPWEIGLAEAQQTLILNNLRSSIRLQVDGKIKSGRDVVIAALLGAEEFGFGTAPLITLGCIRCCKCHLNICPVGIATQDPQLRRRFAGKPEQVINYMRFVARDVREHMAMLGFTSMDDMIGRVEYLAVNQAKKTWKSQNLDLSNVLSQPAQDSTKVLRSSSIPKLDLSQSIDSALIANSQAALTDKEPVSLFTSIDNSNRAVGALLSSEVTKQYGSQGLPPDTIRCKFTGSAGQSFGAFLAPGITFELEGDANDFLGKGLSGGKLIVSTPTRSTFRSHNNVISGNVNLLGATSGEVYINGIAGERFAIRNSGATAVVIGVGDHGCEYMTGGTVVILGKTGINFAAGMSGGTAFVLDSDQLFDTRCNLEMVDIEPVENREDQELLYRLIANHANCTGSTYSTHIIEDWEEVLPQFVKVMPIDFKRVLERIKIVESKETEVVPMTEEVYR